MIEIQEYHYEIHYIWMEGGLLQPDQLSITSILELDPDVYSKTVTEYFQILEINLLFIL